jgi:hypothetical protein
VSSSLHSVLLCVLFASCASEEEPSPPAHSTVTAVPTTPRTLPGGWDKGTRRDFEDLALRLAARKPQWTAADLEELDAAIVNQDERATRAAVLLAHDQHAQATLAMLAHLELRLEAPSRPMDAAAIVCARALEHRTLETDDIERLAALAAGPAPHPDLEVRVGCAAAALGHGNRSVVAFLIRVLRAETPAQVEDPPDWERVTTLFWAKRHASSALSAALKTTLTYRPDGSYKHQAQEANTYAAAFESKGD